MLYFGIWIIYLFVVALITASIASHKGYSYRLWFIFGFPFNILALLLILTMQEHQSSAPVAPIYAKRDTHSETLNKINLLKIIIPNIEARIPTLTDEAEIDFEIKNLERMRSELEHFEVKAEIREPETLEKYYEMVCPYCSEIVKKSAPICKFCKTKLIE